MVGFCNPGDQCWLVYTYPGPALRSDTDRLFLGGGLSIESILPNAPSGVWEESPLLPFVLNLSKDIPRGPGRTE